jgi:hypothetical protein
MLEDALSIQQFLNGRLNLFVGIEEERQLLRGAETNDLAGIFGRSGINQYTKLAADDNAVALAKVIANTGGPEASSSHGSYVAQNLTALRIRESACRRPVAPGRGGG